MMTLDLDKAQITLIFVNYQSAWSLALALKSLHAIESEAVQVIVVNNDIREQQVLKRLSLIFPMKIIVSEHGNIGFGRGANLGASVSTTDILGFINPDILWMTPVLTSVKTFFHATKTPSLLGIQLCDEWGRRDYLSAGPFPSLWTIFKKYLFSLSWRRDEKCPVKVDWVSGGALFCTKSTFHTLGGFDQDFFLYFEDVDLCKKANAQGYTVVLAENIKVCHRGGKSFQSRREQKRYFYASQRTYFSKHRPLWENMFVRLSHFFIDKV